MPRRPTKLARLLQALIACCALLIVFDAPAIAAGWAHDASGWVAPVEVVAVARSGTAARGPERARAPRRRALPALARSAAGAFALPALLWPFAPGWQPDARRLYLQLCALLC